MGEIANDIIEGRMCDCCGCYFRSGWKKDPEMDPMYEHGYPATCWDCWEDMTEEERINHQRAAVPKTF